MAENPNKKKAPGMAAILLVVGLGLLIMLAIGMAVL